MLPSVCTVIDHRRRQNVVRTSVTHSAIASCATFLFLPHFDVICDLLLNRRTATWNLFVKWIQIITLHDWLGMNLEITIFHSFSFLSYSNCLAVQILKPSVKLRCTWLSGCVYRVKFVSGSRVGTVVRALAFHQCVRGSIPGPGVIYGLSLLVLYSAPRGFSPESLVFPSPHKPTFDLI